MGVCPTPARHVARPTLCVSGLCHRLPRAGLGATQTTTDPVRDRRVKFPYPHSLGTLVGVTSGASGVCVCVCVCVSVGRKPRDGGGGGAGHPLGWGSRGGPEYCARWAACGATQQPEGNCFYCTRVQGRGGIGTGPFFLGRADFDVGVFCVQSRLCHGEFRTHQLWAWASTNKVRREPPPPPVSTPPPPPQGRRFPPTPGGGGGWHKALVVGSVSLWRRPLASRP